MATIISIVRRNEMVSFEPSTAEIPRNTGIVFRNEDPLDQHLVTPDPGKPNLWFRHPLAAFVAGRPADVSDEVFFSAATTLPYFCALHAKETGSIKVK